mmetsp:Transcript_1962/g.4443  ORF Transcript_1962/g.4443 Transcript_1962/m.4443 type:complete len:270 (+) Transcript_1962:1194-2003(+)
MICLHFLQQHVRQPSIPELGERLRVERGAQDARDLPLRQRREIGRRHVLHVHVIPQKGLRPLPVPQGLVETLGVLARVFVEQEDPMTWHLSGMVVPRDQDGEELRGREDETGHPNPAPLDVIVHTTPSYPFVACLLLDLDVGCDWVLEEVGHWDRPLVDERLRVCPVNADVQALLGDPLGKLVCLVVGMKIWSHGFCPVLWIHVNLSKNGLLPIWFSNCSPKVQTLLAMLDSLGSPFLPVSSLVFSISASLTPPLLPPASSSSYALPRP